MNMKSLSGVTMKDAGDSFQVEAVFATLDVKDHDGDVTTPGAFGKQAVRISDWNHSTWGGARPVGKGVISEEGNTAVFRGEFFKTQAAQDMRETLKGLGDLAEWSYGFDVDESDKGTKDGEPVRILKKMTVHEVSPVLKGAGIGTRTRYVKSADTLDEHVQLAVEAVESAIERAERVEALRAEKGLALTDAVRKSLEGLEAARKRLADLLSTTKEDEIDKDELAALALRFDLLNL
jgi:hypothetical protein